MRLPNRLGNKESIAENITCQFPEHSYYCELFFGAGGLFFNKRPVAKVNLLNDISEEVYDLYTCLLDEEKKADLYEYLMLIPMHQKLMREVIFEWYKSPDPVRRSVAYIIFSGYTFLGKGSTLRLGTSNLKALAIKQFENVVDFISKNESSIQFSCKNYDKVIPAVADLTELRRDGLVYCDPPYVDTSNNYSRNGEGEKWTIDDFRNLIEHLIEHKVRFAISEKDSADVLEAAKDYKLNIIEVADMHSLVLGFRRREILITNYAQRPRLFD